MYRRRYFAAMGLMAALAACGGGTPNAAGGTEGEAMQEEAQADGYPDVRLEADGGSVTGDSTGGGYMGSATGTTGGGATGGGSRR